MFGPRYRRLRGGDHLEQRALTFAEGTGTHDDSASPVAEQGVADEVAPVRAAKTDKCYLGASHQDARTVVVLSELLGKVKRPATAVAAVEAEDGAADGGTEAEERGQLEVGARGLASRVGAEDEVGDVAGRAAPLGDGLDRGGLCELWDGSDSHVYASVEGWQLSVENLRVGTK